MRWGGAEAEGMYGAGLVEGSGSAQKVGVLLCFSFLCLFSFVLPLWRLGLTQLWYNIAIARHRVAVLYAIE